MDNVTHAAIGAGVFATYAAWAGAPVSGSVATCACVAAVVGSEWPDVDVVSKFLGGPVQYLRQHRQKSHSIPMWFVYSLLTALVLSAFRPGYFWLFAMLTFIGVLTHVGTDMLTTYGTLALWPLSKRRWRGDSLFVVEPFYILLFVVGFVLFKQGVALVPLVLILDTVSVVYTVWRVCLHAWLHHALRRRIADGTYMLRDARLTEAELTWRITPMLFPVPHGYKSVVRCANQFWFGSFSWNGKLLQENTSQSNTTDPVRFVLAHTTVGQALAWFSPMVYATTETDGPLTVVRLADAAVRYSDSLSFGGVVDLVATPHGDYSVVNEGLRAQAVDIQKLWRDTFGHVGGRIRLEIPTPRGYRSNRKV